MNKIKIKNKKSIYTFFVPIPIMYYINIEMIS